MAKPPASRRADNPKMGLGTRLKPPSSFDHCDPGQNTKMYVGRYTLLDAQNLRDTALEPRPVLSRDTENPLLRLSHRARIQQPARP